MSNSVVFSSKENVYFFGDVLKQMEMWGIDLIWLRLMLWLDPRLGLQPSIFNNYSLVELNVSS